MKTRRFINLYINESYNIHLAPTSSPTQPLPAAHSHQRLVTSISILIVILAANDTPKTPLDNPSSTAAAITPLKQIWKNAKSSGNAELEKKSTKSSAVKRAYRFGAKVGQKQKHGFEILGMLKEFVSRRYSKRSEKGKKTYWIDRQVSK